MASIARTSDIRHCWKTTPIRHISKQPKTDRFGAGLFPFHSPLL
uniref:Uncharacterized protein n=1 Tax=Caenorhabditis japonica TaxID=281687 RepID=A0A8R1EFV6_CAEJA